MTLMPVRSNLLTFTDTFQAHLALEKTTHGQARGTFKNLQASLDLNPGFLGTGHT